MLDSVRKEEFREWMFLSVTKQLLEELVTRRQGLLEELPVTLDARTAGRILENGDMIRLVGEYE